MPKTREELEEIVYEVIDNYTWTTDEGDYVLEDDNLEDVAREVVEAILDALKLGEKVKANES